MIKKGIKLRAIRNTFMQTTREQWLIKDKIYIVQGIADNKPWITSEIGQFHYISEYKKWFYPICENVNPNIKVL